MVSKKALLDVLESIAPKHLAMDWDNCGLLIDAKEGYERLLICVDITADVLDEAIEKKCDLIISHHPLIFDPIKSIDKNSIVFKAIQSGISVYAAHTNMDVVAGGVNDTLAKMCGITNCQPLDSENDNGFGCVGTLAQKITVSEVVQNIEDALKVEGIRVTGALDRPVEVVAVACGAGGDSVNAAKSAGVDVLLTGEAKHHEHLLATSLDLVLLEAGHYNTEKHFVKLMAERLQATTDELKYNLQVKISEREKPPYVTI
ncbi:MAG: Nif3-like dinuclear metal center hexameric protein [Eubacteriales bacterium]